MTDKLMIYMDVDGVINSLNHLVPNEGWLKGNPEVHGWNAPDDPEVTPERAGNYTLFIPDYMTRLMQTLYLVADWRWLTTWRDSANEFVSPLLGLPSTIPVIDDGTLNRYVGWKPEAAVLQAKKDVADGYTVFWIEDFGYVAPGDPIREWITIVDTDSEQEGVLLPQHLPTVLLEAVAATKNYLGPYTVPNPNRHFARKQNISGAIHGARLAAVADEFTD